MFVKLNIKHSKLSKVAFALGLIDCSTARLATFEILVDEAKTSLADPTPFVPVIVVALLILPVASLNQEAVFDVFPTVGSFKIAPESNLERAVKRSTLVIDINCTPDVTTEKLDNDWSFAPVESINIFSGKKSRLKTAEADAGKEPIRAICVLFKFLLFL